LKKENLMSLAIIFLGISMMISSYFISNAIMRSNQGIYIDSRHIGEPIRILASEIHELRREYREINSKEKQVMYMSEAAKYLGFSFSELKSLIEEEKINIPYIKVDRTYIFYKDSLDQWLKNIEQQEYTIYN